MNPTLAVALSYAIVVGGLLAYLVGQWREDASLRDRLAPPPAGSDARGDQSNAG